MIRRQHIAGIFLSAFILIAVCSCSPGISQTDSTGAFKLRHYTLFIGSEYYFCTMEDKVIYGKVLGFNEKTVLVECRSSLISLERDNIRLISKDLEDIQNEPQKVARTKYKSVWTIGAGLVFPQGNSRFNGNNPKSAGDYKTGISLFAGWVIPFNQIAAFKGEIDYSHISNGDNYYFSSYLNDSYTTHQTGGNINEATVRAGLGIGNFNTEDKIIFDAFLSLGAGVIFKDASTLYEKYTGTNPKESVYTASALTESLFCFNLNISMKVKISRNAGFFIEPQAGVYSSLNAPFQVVLKAGAFF